LFCALLLGFAASACDDSEEPPSGTAKVRWRSQGQGEANAQALWSLQPNRCAPTSGVVFPPVLYQGRELVPVDAMRPSHFDDLLANFFERKDDGIYWAGHELDGLFTDSLLAIPDTIRDQMAWTIEGVVGVHDFEGKVTRNPAPEGGIASWSVELSYRNDNGYRRRLGLLFTDHEEDQARLQRDSDCLLLHAAPASPAATERTRVALRALHDGAPLLTDAQGESVSAVLDPRSADGRLQLASHVWRAYFASGTLTSSFYPDISCFILEGETFVEADPRTHCPEAGGVVVTEHETAIVPSAGVRGEPYRACTSSIGWGGVTETECFSSLPAIHVLADGRFEGLEASALGFRFGTYAPEEPLHKVRGEQILVENPWLRWPNGIADRFAQSRVESDGSLMLSFGARNQREQLYRFSAGREFTATEVGAAPIGHRSSYSGPEGRFIFHHTTWGRVSRMELAEEGPRLVELADLELPEDHFLVGVFVHEGKLGALTQGGFAGDSPTGPIMGGIYAWLTDFDALTPAAHFTQAAGFGTVFFDGRGDALELCWPEEYGEGILQGWTLDGEEPAAVLPSEKNCVFLLRGAEHERLGGGVWGEPSSERCWARGPLPQLGSITLSTTYGSSGVMLEDDVGHYDPRNIGRQLAALRSGGFVDNKHWLHRGFVGKHPSSTNEYDWGLPDAAGNGLWSNRQGTAELLLLGEEGVIAERPELEVELRVAPGIWPARPAGGGGLLVGDKVLSPRGELRTLPFEADVVLADGTACDLGLRPSLPISEETPTQLPYRCVDKAGVERSGLHTARRGDQAFPSSEGVVIITREFPEGLPWNADYWVFDPSTGESVHHPQALPEHYDDGATAFAYDSEGRLFRFIGLPGNEWVGPFQQLQRLDATGPFDIPLPERDLIGNCNRFVLAVGNDVIALMLVRIELHPGFERVQRFARKDRPKPVACTPSPESCNNQDDDCDGIIDNGPEADQSCATENSNMVCVQGHCAIASCAAGFANCDGEEQNGCETLANSPERCGACEHVCGEGMSCDQGRCTEHVLEVVAGFEHVCALVRGGRVYCFGQAGTLGNGSIESSEGPVAVPIDQVSALVAGHSHTCALREDGSVWCWGNASDGQCGVQNTEQAWIPRQILELPPSQALGVGDSFSCAIDEQATLRCWGSIPAWGSGIHGPAEIAGLSASSVAGGRRHVCALGLDGQVWCFGEGIEGQLGQDAFEGSATPLLLPRVANAQRLWAGGDDGAVRATDGAWLWGGVSLKKLGQNGSEATQVGALGALTGFDATPFFACAASSSGVHCYGSNGLVETFGEAGVVASELPVLVFSQAATSVATADRGVCASSTEGALYCWGQGLVTGQGVAASVPLPTRVALGQ
jgi:hypothetical protein